VEGTKHAYRILHVKIKPSPMLVKLQKAASAFYEARGHAPVTWHHPEFNPHVTVGAVTSEHAKALIGTSLGSVGHVIASEIRVQKFRDPAFFARVIPLSGPI
jgi:2'-5' RNA ligase